jgi:hypothetical protein
MRRSILALLGALFIVALPSIAAGASPNDSATGSGRVADIFGTNADFSFSAHSGPAGEDAEGNLNLRSTVGYTEQNGTASVTCLLVDGNQAIMIGEWKSDDPADWPFGPDFPFSVLIVEDNGQPSGETPDRGIAFGITGFADCAFWLAIAGGDVQPLEQGNVVVHDAS